MAFTACAQKESELYLFVGSYADAADTGISLYRFNTNTGAATLVKEVSGIQDPSYHKPGREVCLFGERDGRERCQSLCLFF